MQDVTVSYVIGRSQDELKRDNGLTESQATEVWLERKKILHEFSSEGGVTIGYSVRAVWIKGQYEAVASTRKIIGGLTGEMVKAAIDKSAANAEKTIAAKRQWFLTNFR